MGRRRSSNAAVLIATAGGLGFVPWAPGTWGSLVGLLVGVAVVRAVPPVHWAAILFAGFVVSALVCTRAEHHLGRHDPPVIILDEVWGMAAVLLVLPRLVSSLAWLAAAFLLFRVFDIAKPAPLRSLARWPAGWGIMADDLGAAAYTIAVLWLTAQLAAFS
jgi:phosphatidylglycerophosphatase A